MIELIDVHKVYRHGQREVRALNGVSLSVGPGEFVALMGPSGCGKSTLLHLLGGLDQPTRGEVRINGQTLAALSDKQITRLRQKKIGIIYQFFNLLPDLSVLENVMLPLVLQGGRTKASEEQAAQWLKEVGLGHRCHHGVHQLSGGEQQRTAIARALIIRPEVILADEPTGNLDSEAGEQVLRLLRDLGSHHGATLVLVTHSRDIGLMARRLARMKDGRIVEETRCPPH